MGDETMESHNEMEFSIQEWEIMKEKTAELLCMGSTIFLNDLFYSFLVYWKFNSWLEH